MKTLTKAGIPVNLYLSPYFPFLSENLLNYYIEKAADAGAKCCAVVPLKIRPIIWKGVKQFLEQSNPSLVAKYEEPYFKNGSKDLSGYWLPELTYRRRIAESIAEKCKELAMRFTAEEFLDLWSELNNLLEPTHEWVRSNIEDKSRCTKCGREVITEEIKTKPVSDEERKKMRQRLRDAEQ